MYFRSVVCVLLTSLAASACSKDPEVATREYVDSARKYVKEGKLQEGIVQYRNAVKESPRSGEVRQELASALYRAGDRRGALNELVRAADLLPKNEETQVSAAELLLSAGLFLDAQGRAEKALQLNPKSSRAQLARGSALAGMRQFDDAIKDVEAAIALDPSRGVNYGSLGVLETLRGNRREAETAFKRAVDVEPSSMQARVALANFYMSSRNTAEAEKVLTEAMKVDPNSVLVSRGLAALYMTTNQPAKAEAPLKQVVSRTKDPRAMMTLADYYINTKRPDDALAVLATAAAADEDSFASATTRKSSILHSRGRHADADAALEEVLKKRPTDNAALVLKSQFLVEYGKYDEALAVLQKAIAANPGSFEAQYALGRLQQKRGALAESMAAHSEVLRLQPRHVDAKVELARLLLVSNKPKEALLHTQAVLSANPNHAEAILLQARAHMNSGNLSAAEQLLRRVVPHNPQMAAVQAQYGSLLLLKKDSRGAKAAFERALAVDQTSVEALRGILSIELAAKDTAAARQRVDAVLAKHPNTPSVLLVAAQAYGATGDAAKAETYVRRVLEVEPSNLQAYGMMAALLASQKKLDAAIAEYEKVATRPDKAVTAHTLIGMLLEYQGKKAEAQKRYELIMSIDRDAPVAANNLAWLYAENGGNLDQALQLAQTARAGLPASPEVADTLGWVFYKKGLTAAAIPFLKEAAEKRPERADMHYHLGLAYAKNGDPLARKSLETALSLDANSPLAGQARAALQSL